MERGFQQKSLVLGLTSLKTVITEALQKLKEKRKKKRENQPKKPHNRYIQ